MQLTVAASRMATVPDITFRSDMTVELVKHAASDGDVIWAARVSTKGEQSLADVTADPERSAGLINYLMRDRHGTPFEHSSMTFYVSAPIFVFREFMRHRTFSYNEESGRYRKLEPVFYVPGPERKLVQTGKPGAYDFSPGTLEQYSLVTETVQAACRQSYAAYLEMLEAGVAREVARTALSKRIRLLQGDARALPCADQSFDLAAAGLVLELLCPADLDRALGELRRAVRPGGRIVLAALADEEPYSRPLSFYLVLRRIIPLAALGAPLKLRQAAARAGLAPRISVRRGLLRLPVDILLCDVPARDA